MTQKRKPTTRWRRPHVARTTLCTALGLMLSLSLGRPALAKLSALVTVVNTTEASAAGVHLNFSDAAVVVLETIQVVPDNAPTCEVERAGTNPVDIHWGADCVDPGAAVSFTVFTGGPLQFVSGAWVNAQHEDIGAVEDIAIPDPRCGEHELSLAMEKRLDAAVCYLKAMAEALEALESRPATRLWRYVSRALSLTEKASAQLGAGEGRKASKHFASAADRLTRFVRALDTSVRRQRIAPAVAHQLQANQRSAWQLLDALQREAAACTVPVCGDGICEGDESVCSCPEDCAGGAGVCGDVCLTYVPVCGDGVCDACADPGESHEACPADCALVCG